jgi:hypothetical protein
VVWHKGFLHQAASGGGVEFHFGCCFLNWIPRAQARDGQPTVVRFYNKESTAKQWVKEGQAASENDAVG